MIEKLGGGEKTLIDKIRESRDDTLNPMPLGNAKIDRSTLANKIADFIAVLRRDNSPIGHYPEHHMKLEHYTSLLDNPEENCYLWAEFIRCSGSIIIDLNFHCQSDSQRRCWKSRIISASARRRIYNALADAAALVEVHALQADLYNDAHSKWGLYQDVLKEEEEEKQGDLLRRGTE